MLLLDLPDEILSHVLESCSQLTDTKGRLGPSAPGRQDIRNFGRTCRQGYRLTEPYLHRSFLLRKAKDVASFLPLLSSDPDGKKVKHIRDLALVPLTDETSSEYRDVAKSVAALPNLEQLIIETPYRTHTAIQDSQDPFEVFQSDLGGLDDLGSGLPGCPIPSWSHRLVTCQLNFQSVYGSLNSLQNLEFVIFAPRLQHLTLIDAHLDGLSCNGVRFQSPHHVSPLQSLSLESCSFTLRGISQLLAIPAALKSFSYYPHHTIVDLDSGRENILGLLSHALSSLSTYQRHSLTDLGVQFDGLADIGGYEEATPRTSHISFSRLTHLTKLKISLSEYDLLHANIANVLLPRLPSSITDLHIEDKHRAYDYPWLTGICYGLLNPLPPPKGSRLQRSITGEAPLPNLANLTIVFTPHYHYFETPLPPRVQPELASSFAEVGHLFRHRFRPLRSRAVHLTVIRRTDITTAVPPYLWDEEQPEDVLVYDSMNPEDTWATETQIEKEKVKEARRLAEESLRLAEEARRRQDEALAAHQAAVEPAVNAAELVAGQSAQEPVTPTAQEAVGQTSDQSAEQVAIIAAQQTSQAEAFVPQVEGE